MAETGFESTALKELCRIYIKWNFLRTNVQVKERSFTLIVIKQTKRILCMWAPKPPHRCYARIRAKSLQPCPTLWDPRDCSPPGSSTHRDSPGKNTGVGCRAFLQGIFQSQRSNSHLLCLLHWQAHSLLLVPPGKPHLCLCCLKEHWLFWVDVKTPVLWGLKALIVLQPGQGHFSYH